LNYHVTVITFMVGQSDLIKMHCSRFHQHFMHVFFVQNFGAKNFKQKHSFVIFGTKILYKKCTLKTLMKLTLTLQSQSWAISNLVYIPYYSLDKFGSVFLINPNRRVDSVLHQSLGHKFQASCSPLFSQNWIIRPYTNFSVVDMLRLAPFYYFIFLISCCPVLCEAGSSVVSCLPLPLD
jgi:hypothetical protein